MNYFNYLISEPIRRKNLSIGLLRLTQILQNRTNGKSSLLIQKIAKILKPKIALGQESTLLSTEQIKSNVESLNEFGWKILDFALNKEEINELYSLAFTKPCWATNVNESIILNEKEISGKYGRYYWKMQDLIETKTVQKLISDSALHTIAQEYIGCRPILSSITMWLDPVMDGSGVDDHKKGKYDPHIYHYDNDGPKFLKFFFYLTDVDKESGAHCVIQKTQFPIKDEKFSTSRRYTEGELLTHYGKENEIIFEAPAGTIIAEDTMAFHKGTDPQKAFRLLLQFEYGLIDNLNTPEANEEKIVKVNIDRLDQNIKSIVNKFYV